MPHSEFVDGHVIVEAGVAFARVQGSCESGRELADESVIGEAQVAQFEGEAYEARQEVGGVQAAVDEDGAVDVWVRGRGEGT